MEYLPPALILGQLSETAVETDNTERDSGHVDGDDRGNLFSLCEQPLWNETILDGSNDEEDDIETDNGHSSLVVGTAMPLPSTRASSTSTSTCGDRISDSERHPPPAVACRQQRGKGEDVKRVVAANSRSSRPRRSPQRARRAREERGKEHSSYSNGWLARERTMSNKEGDAPPVSFIDSRRQQLSDIILQHPEYGGLDPAVRDNMWDIVSTEHPNTASRVDMRRYDVRMATFNDNTLKWSQKSPSPEHLARVGFYFVGIEDRVRCFSCDVELEEWLEEGTPEPLLRHYLAKPHCPFLQQDFHEQIPRLKELANTQHTKYANTSLRLHSFAQWPFGDVVTSYQLASVGFYYTGQGAKVICFSCGLEIKEWKRGDVPLLVHCRRNPDCPFISSIVKKGAPSSAPPQAPPPMLKPLTTSDSSAAANRPDFSVLNIRLKSFKKLSPLFPIPRQQLAEAGLFLLRLPDVMKCYCCNVVLLAWVEGDTAVEKHRGASPQCSYLAEKFPCKLDLSSADDFDPNSLPAAQFDEHDLEQMAREQSVPPHTTTLPPDPNTLPMAGLSLFDVHPYTSSPSHITDPSLPTITSSLATPTSGDPQPLSLTATLTPSNPPSNVGSSGYYSNTHSSAHTGSQSSFSGSTLPPSRQSIDPSLEVPFSHRPPSFIPSLPSFDLAPSTAEVGGKSVSLPPSYTQASPAARTLPSAMTQQPSSLPSGAECVVCMDRPLEMVFVPCGHICVCEECSSQITRCPICRTRTQMAVKVYYPF